MEHSLTLVKSMQFGQEDCFFAFCGYSKTEAHHSFGPAVRDVYVIHIVLEGRGTYSVGNQRYDLQEGQGFVVPPGQSVFYQADWPRAFLKAFEKLCVTAKPVLLAISSTESWLPVSKSAAILSRKSLLYSLIPLPTSSLKSRDR